MSDEAFDEVINTNLKGVFNLGKFIKQRKILILK